MFKSTSSNLTDEEILKTGRRNSCSKIAYLISQYSVSTTITFNLTPSFFRTSTTRFNGLKSLAKLK